MNYTKLQNCLDIEEFIIILNHINKYFFNKIFLLNPKIIIIIIKFIYANLNKY